MRIDPAEFSRRMLAMVEADAVIPLRAATMHALALLGIERAYFLAPLTADARIGRILTNVGFSPVWERHYRAHLMKFDPLPAFALELAGAFRWPEDLDDSKFDKRQRHYLKIAGQFGQDRGIGVACYGPHGRSGFLGCEWTASDQAPIHVRQGVGIIGQTSFRRYCILVRDDSTVPALSNRELEVLGWMCSGKSNSVIAQLIGVSPSSVDVYTRRLFQKLDVTDRTAACLKGYSLGLTVANDYRTLVAEAEKRRQEGRE